MPGRRSRLPGSPRGEVIYLGTFSKTLFPGLRLAYAVPAAQGNRSGGGGTGPDSIVSRQTCSMVLSRI